MKIHALLCFVALALGAAGCSGGSDGPEVITHNDNPDLLVDCGLDSMFVKCSVSNLSKSYRYTLEHFAIVMKGPNGVILNRSSSSSFQWVNPGEKFEGPVTFTSPAYGDVREIHVYIPNERP